MYWEVSNNQSFLWSGNPRSSVVVEGTTQPSYSRPGAMALSRGNFLSYLKAACPTLNNWDSFVWSSLLCCLLSLLTTKIWTREENIFFKKKNNNKKVPSLGHIGRKESHFFKNKIIPETVHWHSLQMCSEMAGIVISVPVGALMPKQVFVRLDFHNLGHTICLRWCSSTAIILPTQASAAAFGT